MTDKEKEILKKLSFLIPKVSEAKKEYLLGFADGIMFDVTNIEKEREASKRKSNVVTA